MNGLHMKLALAELNYIEWRWNGCEERQQTMVGLTKPGANTADEFRRADVVTF